MSIENNIPGLNYTLPFWQSGGVDAALQGISVYAGEFAGPAWRALKIRDGINKLADVYVQTNGNASLDELAAAMDTTHYQFSYLPAYLGREQGFKQLVLWSSVHWDQASDFIPNGRLLALVIIFTMITIITTALRLYSRWRGPIGLKVLDYMFTSGVLVAIVMAGIWGSAITMLSDAGSGAIWNVTYDQYIRTQVNSFLLGTLYHAAIGLIKCPIFLFYYFITPIRYHRIILAIILGCCIADNLVGFFFNIFRYQPVDFWNHRLQYSNSDYNVSVEKYADKLIWIVGVANIVLDCLIWVIPIPTLLTLGKTWKTRALSVAIVLSGTLPSIFSALRAVSIAHGDIQSTDGSLSNWDVNVYSFIEIHIMIWCFNIPALRSLATSIIAERRNRYDTADRTRVGSNDGTANNFVEKNGGTFLSQSSEV